MISISRIFDEGADTMDINRFKKYSISLNGNALRIDNEEINFTIQKLNPQKVLGKGSLYDYFKDYVLKNYNIHLANEVSYINVEFEKATKEPFKNFFLAGHSAILLNEYLYLFSNDGYLLTYRTNIVNTILSNESKYVVVSLSFDFEDYTKICLQEKTPNCQNRCPSLTDSKFDEIINILGLTEGIPSSIFCLNTGNSKFDTFLLNYDGDSSSQDIVTISNDKVISIVCIGYTMPEETTYDTFLINTDLTIDIFRVSFTDLTTKTKKNPTYKIPSDGKIISL